MKTDKPKVEETIGKFGRTGRMIFGILFLGITILVFMVSSDNPLVDIISSASVFVGITMIYFLIHRALESNLVSVNPLGGAILANGIVGIIMGYGYFFQILPVFIGSTAYVGITLLIASYKKFPGCEVMSLPAVMTNKHTSLPCLVFTPIDNLEKKS